MGRVVGIDYGRARLGLAVSDERAIIAQPRPCIVAAKTLEETAKRVAEELNKQGPIQAIVIGLPLHLSGKESPMSEEVRKFAEFLKAFCPVDIILWDERLSTAQVDRGLKEANLNRKKRAAIVDSLSATLILQNFLDRNFSSSL